MFPIKHTVFFSTVTVCTLSSLVDTGLCILKWKFMSPLDSILVISGLMASHVSDESIQLIKCMVSRLVDTGLCVKLETYVASRNPKGIDGTHPIFCYYESIQLIECTYIIPSWLTMYSALKWKFMLPLDSTFEKFVQVEFILVKLCKCRTPWDTQMKASNLSSVCTLFQPGWHWTLH